MWAALASGESRLRRDLALYKRQPLCPCEAGNVIPAVLK